MSAQKPEEQKSKIGETLDSLKKNQKVESLVSYAKTNTVDTIAYILAILGIVLILFNSFYGAVIIGLVAGYYYSAELVAVAKNVNQTIHEMGIPKSLILGSVLVALFILAPGLFIGAAVAAALTHVIKG